MPTGRIKSLAYDKAADDNESHALLHEAGINPVIQNRRLWKDRDGTDASRPRREVEHRLRRSGNGLLLRSREPADRAAEDGLHRLRAAAGTLKYRCPARHEGWTCPSDALCNAGKSYGKTVRVKSEIDLRRFPPIPRATKKFERLYKGRTARGAGQRPLEDFLGRRRRQRDRGAAVSRDGRA